MESGSTTITLEEHISLQTASGLSVKKYCIEHGLKEHQFRYWKSKSGRSRSSVKFELAVAGESMGFPDQVIMRLVLPNKTEIWIYSLPDPEYLRMLMTC